MSKSIRGINSSKTFLQKNANKNFNLAQYSKVLISVIVVLVILTVGILGYYTYLLQSVTPTSSLSQEAAQRLLIKRDGLKSTLFILQDSDNIKIQGAWYVIYNEKNSSTVVYFIPPGVFTKEYLSSVSDYVSVGDLKYIGDTLAPKRQVEYTVWQLGNLTGMTPDAYIWLNIDSLSAFSKLFGDVSEFSKDRYLERYSKSNEVSTPSLTINSLVDKYSSLKLIASYTNYQKFIQGIDSNLSTWEIITRLQLVGGSLSSNSIDMLDLSQIWATQKVTSESGREINLVNYDQVDMRLNDFIKDLKGRDIEREQVKIEIYKASEISGLASRYSRKFKNSGIDVVRFENAPSSVDRTVVYIPKKDKFINSLNLVEKLLVVDSDLVEGRPDFMTTADIVVILGKDMEREASWK